MHIFLFKQQSKDGNNLYDIHLGEIIYKNVNAMRKIMIYIKTRTPKRKLFLFLFFAFPIMGNHTQKNKNNEMQSLCPFCSSEPLL